jgi:TAT-translocated FGD2 family F420-dependent dehydrogenase
MLKSAAALLGVAAMPGSLRAGAPPSNQQPTSSTKEIKPLSTRTIGFMLSHEQFTAAKLVELGAVAERVGFDLLSISDHFQPWQSNEGHAGQAWVTLGATGQKTHRVWMGPTVTCPTFRYKPAVVAEAFATLSHLYPGRIFLGIGSGEALNEQAAVGSWPKWEERSERLIEAADIIRKLWTGQPVSHKGKFYDVNAKLYDPPSGSIPLLMAANGPKAMRRAGQYADGLITDPKTWKQYKTEFQDGAKAAGKNPAQMPVLVEQYVIVGKEEEAKSAAELWRFGPKAFKDYYNVRDPQEIQQRAEKEIPLEKVYEEWPVSTDPSVHAKAVKDLFNSGVTIVNIHSGQADQMKVIDFYGKEVLPRVRS